MEWLKSVGINEKLQKLYICLLENGALSATELARMIGEQRTNIYLLTDQLIARDLIDRDETGTTAKFKVNNPENLQRLFAARQTQLANSAKQMKSALPELMGLYHLKTASEGIAYFEGIKGYEAALEDMAKSQQEICVFGASSIPETRPDIWNVLLNKLHKRALAKIRTRIIFDTSLQASSEISAQRSLPLQKYMEVRFWGNHLFDGEVALYEGTVVLTSYDEELISLVIKNPAIYHTLQTVFNTAWESTAPSSNS